MWIHQFIHHIDLTLWWIGPRLAKADLESLADEIGLSDYPEMGVCLELSANGLTTRQ